ncbi:sensor histidine kinase [Brachybacterium epidermidis]|uniref:sensor histidine kinase n=1 Tax=Brachybacterium epidermidis TaxID=2781983 RepID=UPI00398F1627
MIHPLERLRRSAWTPMTVAVAGFLLAVVGWPVAASTYDVDAALAMVMTVAHSVAAVLAVRWPWAGLALAVPAALATMIATAPAMAALPWPWPVTALIAHCLTLTVLAVCHRWYWSISGWAAGALLTLGALVLGPPRGVLTNGVVLVAVSGAVVLLGLMVRQWILIAGQVEKAQSLSAAEARRRRELEERNRIARELHDVVAHSMSVITVQAGTARYRIDGLGEQTEREFEDIAASSRQALGEMRSLLALLRTEGAPGGDDRLDTMPMPGLPELEELVEASRASGATISCTDVAELSATVAVPATAGLVAYRVVQEALSNALRHAPGSAIAVRITADPADDAASTGTNLLVQVTNTAPATASEAMPGSGMGLAGLRERVASLGGAIAAAPTEEGGFEVRARIPLAEPTPR